MDNITFHYGKYVNRDIAITGVVNNNSVMWLYDEIDYNEKTICLTCEECQEENKAEFEKDDNFCDMCEVEKTYLIGDWIKDSERLYDYDPMGEYAAIVNSNPYTTQVIFSKTTKKCKLCSPCYPGQGDLDSTGDFLTYNLPIELYEEN